jgi:TolA-binding protein
VEFKSFLKQYKDHDLSEQAQYYIAESLYSQSKYSEAYEEYKKVEELYPDSKLIPSARLKMALCLELLNKKNDAIIVLQTILTDFPKSAEAFTAKEKIKIYTNDKSR